MQMEIKKQDARMFGTEERKSINATASTAIDH